MTAEDASFTRRALPVGLIDYAAEHRVLRKATRDLLNVVFDHEGYIAGGFAILLARHFVLGEDAQEPDDLAKRVVAHLRDPRDPAKAPPGRPDWHNAACGDIDVWFPDESTLRGFMEDPRRVRMINDGTVCVKDTNLGFGVEHVVLWQAKVQVITKYLRPIETQLSNFDIYNSMVALTRDSVVMAEHWAALEGQRTLHVSTWASPWTVNRFMKYLEKKGYEGVTPLTADAFIDEAIKALDWYRNVMSSLPKDRADEALARSSLLRMIARAPERVQYRLFTVIKDLPAERLLEVSAFFKAPASYDCAMQEIHRRMPEAQKQACAAMVAHP